MGGGGGGKEGGGGNKPERKRGVWLAAGEGGVGRKQLEVGAKGGRKNWRRSGLTLHKKLAVQLLDTCRSVKKNV